MPVLPMVHIVDDDEAIRSSLRLLIKTSGLNPRTYISAEELLETADLNQHGCLVVDIRMPGMSGLELQQHLNRNQYKIPLIIITGHGDIEMAVQAMKSGARDFLEKPVDNDKLIHRIRESLELDSEMRNHDREKDRAAQLLARLSSREHEIMQLLIQGKLNKVIAADLDISVRTVEAHRANIMHKMEARSLSDIVRIGITAT
ncbi:MAG: response regulator transcription factor [Gammaproteobacteria bacterium]|nr:MAG: response regulator transcription factor [Gammaproteobacteria bacterium]